MVKANPTQKAIEQAQTAYAMGDFQKAAALFDKLSQEYLNAGNKLISAEMANNSSVSYLKIGDATRALEATLGTDQIFSQANDLENQAIALGNQAAALEALGQLDKALTLYKQSADLLKQTNNRELRSFVLQSISTLQLRLGKFIEAMFTMNAALDFKKTLSIKDRCLKQLLKIPSRLIK